MIKDAAKGLLIVGIAALAVMMGAADAEADSLTVKNFHYFRPPADGSGMLFSYGSESLNWLGMHYGGYVDDSIDPLEVEFEDGDKERLIENQVNVNALYAIGLTRYANVGLAVPAAPYRAINDEFEDEDIPTWAFEDLRFDAKGILFDRRRRCFGLALNVTTIVPVDNRDNSFLTDGGFGLAPRLIADLGRTWWTVALNAGYGYNRSSKSGELEMEIGDEAIFTLGAIFRLRQYGQIILDTQFRTPVDEFFTQESTSYGEALGGYRYFFGTYSPIAVTAGAGAGLLDGAGSPRLRVFVGVTVYEHRLKRGR